jgi:pyruvate dehydrogenase E2 component (dihydrolipoamide acetyltransferase)
LMKNTTTQAQVISRPAQTNESNKYIDVAGTRIRYMEMGRETSDPPLLMVHGYNGSCDYWFPYAMPGLATERRVVALDLPGNGWSGAWARYSFDSYASFIGDFMDAIDLQRADMLGHSMGGQVACLAAAKRPERFGKLILVSSAGARKLRLNPITYIKMLADPSMRQIGLYPIFLRVALRGRASFQSLQMLQHDSIGSAFKRLTMPILIIWGDRDQVIPLDYGNLMAKQLPRARFEVIKGAGHMPFYEKPDEFNRLVLDFLR